MWERILTAIANSVIGSVLAQVFDAIRQRRIDKDQQEVGRKDERLAAAKAALEAEERMKKARQAPGVDDAEKRLNNGTF